MFKRFAAATAALCLTAGPALAEQLSLEPGQWEHTMEMTMSMTMNGQAMSMPTQSQTRSECVTEEEATFDPQSVASEGCSVEDVNQQGRSLSFTMVCDQQGVSLTGEMDMSLSQDGRSMSGEMSLAGSGPGMESMAMTGTFSGERTGDCA